MVTTFKFKTGGTITAAGIDDIIEKQDSIVKNIDEVIVLLDHWDYTILRMKEEDLHGFYQYYGARVHSFPIPDMTVPNMNDFHKLLLTIVQKLRRGEHLLLHCFGGVGRTGTILIGLCILLGQTYEEAYATLSARRKVLDTKRQMAFLQHYERAIKRTKSGTAL